MSAPEPTAEEVAAFNREEGTATPTPAPVDAAERVRAYLRGVADMRPGEWVSTSTIVGALGLTFPDADGWLTALEHRREVESLDYGIWWRIVSMKRTPGAETQPALPPVATAPVVDLDACERAIADANAAARDWRWERHDPTDDYVGQCACLEQTMIQLADTYEGSPEDCRYVETACGKFPALIALARAQQAEIARVTRERDESLAGIERLQQAIAAKGAP